MRKRNKQVEHNEFLTTFIEMTDFLENAELQGNLNVRKVIRKLNGYQETIQMNNGSVEELEHQVIEREDELQKHDVFMKNKEYELAMAKIELENAKKKVNTIGNSLSEAKKFHNNLEVEKNDLQLLIAKQKKLGEKMSRVILLHKSAEEMKKRISNYQLGIIVVNKCDNNGYIKDVVKPDRIVVSEELENFIIHIPYDLEKYNEKEQESIIAYCKLVANVMAHMDDYSRIKLLYCNEDIARILRMNGIGV